MTNTRGAGALITLLLAASAVGEDGVGDWFMDGGGAARTSFVDVAPIRNAPVELWRKKLDEGVACDPVVWNGLVFVASRSSGGMQVIDAVDARTGVVVAHAPRLGHPIGRLSLAVWRNVVVAVEPDQIEAFALAGSTFRSVWKATGGSNAAPCVFQGVAIAGGIACDAVSGRATPWSTEYGDAGGPSIVALPGDRAMMIAASAGPHGKYVGTWLRAGARYLARCSGGPATMAVDVREAWNPVAQFAAWEKVALPLSAVAVRLESTTAGQPGAWIFAPDAKLSTPSGKSGGLAVHVDKGANELVPGVARPAVCDGAAYTFDAEGDLLAVHADGTFDVAARAEDLPPHEADTRLSAARATLYAPSWAFDVATKKVAWSHAFERRDRFVGAAIPTGDGLVVLRDDAGELVCLADPQRPATVHPKAPVVAKTEGPPKIPVAGDGVILKDGRQFLGAAMLNGVDRILVTPKDGDPRQIAVDDVLVAETGGVVIASASEREVLAFWDAALRPVVEKRLDDAVVAAMELGLVKQAAACVEAARKWGMTEARVAELTKKLAGKTDPTFAEPKQRAFEKKSAPLYAACIYDVSAAAQWCGARAFAVAGGVLASHLSEIEGGGAQIEDVSAKLAPADFAALMGASGLGKKWREWSAAMMRADAQLLAKDDPAWARVQEAPWTKETLGFRTPNLLFFTRSTEAAVVGPCLLHGEAAVRGLRKLLGGVAEDRAATDDERLEVRLHRDRDDYLAEGAKTRNPFLAFTLGYYSPSENVSRFYVPEKSPVESVERGLFNVLAHELTHHFVEGRWIRAVAGFAGNDISTPGYWIVEGIAVFMADQIVDADARGLTFEDPSVRSVTFAAYAEGMGAMFPANALVDMNHAQFGQLGGDPKWKIPMPGTRYYAILSEKNLFYEFGGALVFFLRNGRGDEGRKAFVEYLRGHYTGQMARESWKVLGFDSADALQTAFKTWLRSLKH